MTLNIKKYAKTTGEKGETQVTSISLDLKQKQFIDAQKINLSALVRDVIESLIKESSTKK